MVGALLELSARWRLGESRLAASDEAEALLRSDGFAFLVAVLLDHGVPAERAFAAPWVLRQRLGHLAPQRLVAEPARLRRAMRRRPMPHRYPDVAARWILGTARVVVDECGGETARLWSDRPAAGELQSRLQRLPGIGQKKAAMAVELLSRELGVPLRALHGSDVAVDVHVRRVFLRTGLVHTASAREIIAVARHAHPERPSELDLPAWLIGRTWCRPRAPLCGDCPIAWACPSS